MRVATVLVGPRASLVQGGYRGKSSTRKKGARVTRGREMFAVGVSRSPRVAAIGCYFPHRRNFESPLEWTCRGLIPDNRRPNDSPTWTLAGRPMNVRVPPAAWTLV
ncbi:hypothetical protein KQX54_021878 [Cotesia glomerata]|uniref:Uncharacterized protein n=1 Tax=Cotesia glomerata TaxID=32391 RepID=A0AAV7JA51_COTGL|nr:hypothetical protein KQX54_021878 [Cotesia glomerata]